jgi:hypothetical protein
VILKVLVPPYPKHIKQCGRFRGSPTALTKANPDKITMASRFSVRPPVAPTKLEDLKQRDQQLEPLRAGQRKRSKNASRLKREIEFDRRRSAQIESTNHRHNYGQL